MRRSALATSNDLGLFADQFAAECKELLGNFPQGLTHLADISAALALARIEDAPGRRLEPIHSQPGR